jgi:hypothetical protein
MQRPDARIIIHFKGNKFVLIRGALTTATMIYLLNHVMVGTALILTLYTKITL